MAEDEPHDYDVLHAQNHTSNHKVPGILELSKHDTTIICCVIIVVFAVFTLTGCVIMVIRRRKKDPEYRMRLAHKLLMDYNVNAKVTTCVGRRDHEAEIDHTTQGGKSRAASVNTFFHEPEHHYGASRYASRNLQSDDEKRKLIVSKSKQEEDSQSDI